MATPLGGQQTDEQKAGRQSQRRDRPGDRQFGVAAAPSDRSLHRRDPPRANRFVRDESPQVQGQDCGRSIPAIRRLSNRLGDDRLQVAREAGLHPVKRFRMVVHHPPNPDPSTELAP